MPRSKNILMAAVLAVVVAAAAWVAAADHAHDHLCGRVCTACHIAPLAAEGALAALTAHPPAGIERMPARASSGEALDSYARAAASRAPPSSLL